MVNEPDFGGKFEVGRVLGHGGMGTVFEARHHRLGQSVAIKVLGAELGKHAALVTRFEREARAAGALSSPHAVRVFDIDQTDDGRPFIVMELLSGCDLARLLEHEGRQPIADAVRWIIEACDAIGEAHRLGIVHRDLKPSNLFLCESGSIKVVDFGIAKRVASTDPSLTLGTEPLGTPQYMAPEQVRTPQAVDARSDIWSLGATLFELVCGRPPFDEQSPEACIASLVVDPVPDPKQLRADLPDALAAALLKALSKKPEDRFQSIEEWVSAIAPFAQTRPGSLTAVPRTLPRAWSCSVARPTESAPPRRRSKKRAAVIAAGVAMLGLVFFVRSSGAPATPISGVIDPRVAEIIEAPLVSATPAVELPVVELDEADAAPAPTSQPKVTRVAKPAMVAARPLGVHGGISNPGF